MYGLLADKRQVARRWSGRRGAYGTGDVQVRLPKACAPIRPGCRLQSEKDVRKVGLPEVLQGSFGRAEVSDVAAWSQHEDEVAHVQLGNVVSDHDDGAAIVRQLAQR